jgi:hypothetical protein
MTDADIIDAMEITIPKRFCGPPESGNGGYSCGRLAAFIGTSAEVTLRAPPPLDTPLALQGQDGAVRLVQGERLIAEGRAADLALDVPAPPPWDDARAAARRYNGLREHVYGTCFVCGPKRAPADGLRIFCGPWRQGMVAGTWTPDATLEDGQGAVRPEFLWAAIDCPGSWSVIGRDDPDAPVREIPSTMLLGRLTGKLFRSLRVGEDCTVLGWFLGAEGRKYHVGTAVHTRAGDLVAASRATWVALKAA